MQKDKMVYELTRFLAEAANKENYYYYRCFRDGRLKDTQAYALADDIVMANYYEARLDELSGIFEVEYDEEFEQVESLVESWKLLLLVTDVRSHSSADFPRVHLVRFEALQKLMRECVEIGFK